MMEPPSNVVVAITGASGVAIGARVLQLLQQDPGIVSHAVVSKAGAMTLQQECGITRSDIEAMADVVHRNENVGATIASGSYPVQAMIVAPCTIKTLSSIAYGFADNLITRAADVSLKQGRPLVLMVRESPLHHGHLTAMQAATAAGAIIAPPMPAFYEHPKDTDDIVDGIARRALDRAGLGQFRPQSWPGLTADRAARRAD